MPKGQPREAKDRVLTIEERIKALQDEKANILKTDAEKEKRKHQRRAFIIGETILDAKLTHEEKAVICGIMSRRVSTPKDWDAVSDFTIHSVPTATHGFRGAAPEFVRTGK